MEPLLDSSDWELIRRLELSPRRRLAGQVTGEQRSPALGGGIEFADYREYVPGDDVRQVDWSVFLRFRKLMVKLSAEEKELTLMTLVDTTRSMAWGQPSKFRQAQRIAAILAGIALTSGNRAGVLSWGDRLVEAVEPLRGARSVSALADRIGRLEATDEGRPLDGVRQFATRYARRCLAVVVSDFLNADWLATLQGLGASGAEVHVVHVLAPEELEPLHRGELTLVDQENGSEAALLVDAALLDRYRNEMQGWLGEVASVCRSRGMGYTLVPSNASLPRLFLQDLVRSGLVC